MKVRLMHCYWHVKPAGQQVRLTGRCEPGSFRAETLLRQLGELRLFQGILRAAAFADLHEVVIRGQFLHMHFDGVAVRPVESSISLTVILSRILASSSIWREKAGKDDRRACSSLTLAASLSFCFAMVLRKNTSQYSQFCFFLWMVCWVRRNAR